jgi:Zn-dependent protease
MLGWSLKLFRIRGIQLAIHSSFFLLLAYVAAIGYQPNVAEGNVGGWTGVAWNITILIAFFTCVVLHELGHSFTAMRFGVNVRRILLMPIGGMAEFDSIPREPARELLITIAGPLVNFVLAFGFWWAIHELPGDDVVLTPFTMESFTIQMFYANAVMGCFNLLPAFPMDGGRMLRASLAWRRPYLQATRWAAHVGKVISVLGAGVAIWYSVARHQDLWLVAALFAFIFVAGEIEYRAAARRERDDAHWREVLARLYATPPASAEDPPVLSS